VNDCPHLFSRPSPKIGLKQQSALPLAGTEPKTLDIRSYTAIALWIVTHFNFGFMQEIWAWLQVNCPSQSSRGPTSGAVYRAALKQQRGSACQAGIIKLEQNVRLASGMSATMGARFLYCVFFVNYWPSCFIANYHIW